MIGESSHPQERERGGRMTSSMIKAAGRGSSQSADLITVNTGVSGLTVFMRRV